MPTPLGILMPPCFLWGSFWVIDSVGEFVIWAGIFVGVLIILGLAKQFVSAHQARQRCARNDAHCARFGYEFSASPKLEEVTSAGSLFQRAGARVEQLATGQRQGADFEVFDLAYTEIVHNDNGSSTTVREQTVAILRDHGLAGTSLAIAPTLGLAGAFARLLGLHSTIAILPVGLSVEDQALYRWFARNYRVSLVGQTDGRSAECLIRPLLLRWLRNRHKIAFENVDGHLVVWRPDRLVDSRQRDSLVEEAAELAKLLQTPGESSASPAVRIDLPAVLSFQRLFLAFVISAFVSWGVAIVLGMACFFGIIATGLIERFPVPSFVGAMAIVLIAWVGSGLSVFYRIVRYRSRSE